MAEKLAHPERPTGRSTILVVDDEPAVCVSLQGVLNREGYRTFVANDGPAALEILDRETIDLVLLDLNMPVMSGLSLMHIIRERWPYVVIMILTGYGTLESAVNALRQGAHDYLLKPATPEDIKASVREGLDKRQKTVRRRQLLTSIEASVRALTQDPLGPRADNLPASSATQAAPTHLEAGNLLIDL